MKKPCGCCEGIETTTPEPTANRPGLNAIRFRIGRHTTFLETMKARLARQSLRGLQTRESSDPTIALLDAWATVADVLTFYQERIANEGYLHTATERRSTLELARLVGYRPRSGVAASVYLAFSMENGSEGEIPAGTRVQSLPGPGELPQVFETSEKITARAVWNGLKPRSTRPQLMRQDIIECKGLLYFKGTNTGLEVGSPLMIDYGNNAPELYRVIGVTAQQGANRTRVRLEKWVKPSTEEDFRTWLNNANPLAKSHPAQFNTQPRQSFDELLKQLDPPNNETPVHRVQEVRRHMDNLDLGDLPVFMDWLRDRATIQNGNTHSSDGSDPVQLARRRCARQKSASSGTPPQRPIIPAVGSLRIPKQDLEKITKLSVRDPVSLRLDRGLVLRNLSDVVKMVCNLQFPNARIADAMRGTPNPDFGAVRVYRFGVKAALFGHNALEEVQSSGDSTTMVGDKNSTDFWLDSVYKGIIEGTPVAIVTLDKAPQFTVVKKTQDLSRSDYNMSGKLTKIEVDSVSSQATDINFIRSTTVFTQAQPLELAEMPVFNALGSEDVELDTVVDGLELGRWVIVTGERTDMGHVCGVQGAELVMLAGVDHRQDEALPGDRSVTWLTFAEPLAYTYKPGTITIFGNVVKATHGETRTGVLGSGDGSRALQHFELRQKPLTYLPAVTPDGVTSTLETRINDLLWHETGSLSENRPTDRAYATQTDDDNRTSLTFGDGEHGARLPTGLENVRAKYRTGIGKAGNVDAGKITLLSTRPLGVKSVTNPIRASGGAERDTRDQMRKNIPLGIRSLGRIVSVEDYADFARTFAGIGKAQAVRLVDGTQTLVYLTIAGIDDIPIDESSDLFVYLKEALRRNGDPRQAVQVAVRDLLALVIDARVRIAPDYEWETVKPKIMARLLDQFSFERRELGQDVTRSEVVSTIQNVQGVVYVDLETMDCLTREMVEDMITLQTSTSLENLTLRGRVVADVGRFLRNAGNQFIIDETTGRPKLVPAQIAYLRPDLPQTLILNRI